MTPTTLIRSFAAVCAAAVFLPAQEVEEIVIQDPQPSARVIKVDRSAKDLKKQLAEIIATLEDDDATAAERAKAKKKLLEVVARLTDKADATAKSFPATGRVVVRQGDGDGHEVVEYRLEDVTDAKAKAEADVAEVRRRVAKLDRLQKLELETAVEKAREAGNGVRADALRERAEALRAKVVEANPEARELRGRVVRLLENAEKTQEPEGGRDASVERFSKLLRSAMERRRASTEAERAEQGQDPKPAEEAKRQFEAARRALEQARKELKKAQAEIEAAHGAHEHGFGVTVVPKLHEQGHDVLLELDTKLDRVLPKKDGKAKKENNVFFFEKSGEGSVDVRSYGDGKGGIWVQKGQGEGDAPVTLRWVEGGAKPPKAPKPVKPPKAPKAPKGFTITKDGEGDAGAVRWRVVAPKADDEGNVVRYRMLEQAPNSGGAVYFGDYAEVPAKADGDDDDGDLRQMIEELRKEMRELRAVLREVKAHIGAAAPANTPFRGFPGMPAAPPAPAALPATRDFAPGEVRRARFVPGTPAVAPARTRVGRVAAPSLVAPLVNPPQPAATPRAVPAPTSLGGIK